MKERSLGIVLVAVLMVTVSCGGGSEGETTDEQATAKTTKARANESLGTPPVEASVEGAPPAEVLREILERVAPDPVETTTSTVMEVPACREYTITSAEFGSGEHVLNESARRAVERIASDLSQLDGAWTVDIIGHTDSLPTTAKGGNQRLSEQRAEAVAAELGLPETRVSLIDGRADSEPVAVGSSAEALAKNRRVELLVRC